MNHKELVREMREMHEEQMSQLRALTQAVLQLAQSGLAIQSGTAIMGEPRRHSTAANLNAPAGVDIDESIFVTEVDTSDIEKGFDDLAETKTEEDAALKGNLSKLRAFKKGD